MLMLRRLLLFDIARPVGFDLAAYAAHHADSSNSTANRFSRRTNVYAMFSIYHPILPDDPTKERVCEKDIDNLGI